MSEWWTYRLSSFLLFSPTTYARLVERYNADVWPLQVAAIVLGALLIALLHRGPADRGRYIALILAACWSWVAWAFLWNRYAAINWAAAYFAAAFVIEALLLLWIGVVRNSLEPRPGESWMHRAGVAIIVVALAGTPLVGIALGRPLLRSETFGVMPDPTAIVTLAFVLLASQRTQSALLPIPLLWCAISGATQWALHAPDALVTPLVAAAIVALSAAGATLRLRSSRRAADDRTRRGRAA